ncbi:MAG: non-canonical purine NTP pyrophosphatase [Anaerolineae bacterium]|nr:non-canonical purine NTP pyrophosphatase [Anaerolineae bacterium]
MLRQLLYATLNPGKLMEIRALLHPEGIDILAPGDVGLDLDVVEDGTTLEANAAAKARAYMQHLGDNIVVLGDDTGVEIDALDGAPGIHVRRWDGSARMTDEAIIAYCLDKLHGVPTAQRGAQFRTVFAIGVPGGELAFYDGVLRGVILEEPDPLRIQGFPFEALFYVPEWAILLGKVHQLPPEQKRAYVTHRERALRRALPYVRGLLGMG